MARTGLPWALVLAWCACDDGGSASLPDDARVGSLPDAAAVGEPDARSDADPVAIDAAPGDALPLDSSPPDAFAPDAIAVDALAPDATSPDAAPPPATAPLDEARAAILSLDAEWRFRLDPEDVGAGAGWAAVDHEDGEWDLIDAGRTWEEQGFPDYDGVAWYRRRVDVPAEWAGSRVRFIANGVDDEYDLYVNGAHQKHHGEAPDRSVWGWRTHTPIESALRFGEANGIAVRVRDWGGGGGLWRSVVLRRTVPLRPYRAYLPEPVLDGRPEWVELYWAAWRFAWEKVAFGNARNGLVDAYLDEGFNEQIYQWDSAFMCRFAHYGRRLLPVMPTLDNFYDRQRPDGYIQRVYSETDGGEMGEPTPDEPMVNPPLFAWLEWSYYGATGDGSRLERVLPILERCFEWLRANVTDAQGRGLYYQTDLGSGMDNTPRGDVHRAGGVDMTAQQALAALCLSRMAEAIGEAERAAAWRAEHTALAERINRLLWMEGDGWYSDLRVDGQPTGVRHVGGVWALLAEVPDAERAARLVAHLRDPAEFYRPHLFPTLAASHPDYDPAGRYWRGGVWAPTNYMSVQGLLRYGFDDLAREAAHSHLDQLARVYAEPPPVDGVAPEEQDGDYRTLWECYAPERAAPATRWDGRYYARQDFVGWTGLGPIAMLIEVVIGVEIDAPGNRVRWTLTRTDRHGVRRLQLGAENLVGLVAAARADAAAPVEITVGATRPFTLEVTAPGAAPAVHVLPAGEHVVRYVP